MGDKYCTVPGGATGSNDSEKDVPTGHTDEALPHGAYSLVGKTAMNQVITRSAVHQIPGGITGWKGARSSLRKRARAVPEDARVGRGQVWQVEGTACAKAS